MSKMENEMNNKNDEKLQQVLEDIKLIKKAVEKNNSIMKLIPLGEVLNFVFLLGGIFVLAISTSVYCLIQHFGSYADIPFEFKALLYLLCLISILSVGSVKSIRVLKAVRNDGRSVTYLGLMKEIYSRQFTAILLPFFMVLVVVITFLATHGFSVYIVSFFAIWYALVYKTVIQLFGIEDVFIITEWLLLTGLVSLFMMDRVHPLIILNITFGVGCIMTAIVNYIFHAKKRWKE
ncbi:MAG: hypothetical protein LR001_07470 [Clostridiales bacterium]|nr:hypothetical protein [Clostridiales bacterium]